MKLDFYEVERIRQMSIFENLLRERGYKAIAGVDEAGRGPLAGPVVIAACILPVCYFLEQLNDSKKLLPEQREKVYKHLIQDKRVTYSVCVIDVDLIDRLNILHATMHGMKKAVESLPVDPDYVLIDGNRMPELDVSAETIVAGDSYSISIAAASIIAKCERDKIMESLHHKWPEYGFKMHKGYATEEHLKVLIKHGPTPIHRKTFDPVKSMLAKQKPEQLSLLP